MPIRLRQSAKIEVSSSTRENKDLGNVAWEIVTDGLGEGGAWKTLVPAGASLLELKLDNIANVKFLVLLTSAKDPTQTPVALDFRKNGSGGEIFQVKPLSSVKQGQFLITSEGITSLFVTNAGAVDMEVVVVAGGD